MLADKSVQGCPPKTDYPKTNSKILKKVCKRKVNVTSACTRVHLWKIQWLIVMNTNMPFSMLL